jgi:hypothetical protein
MPQSDSYFSYALDKYQRDNQKAKSKKLDFDDVFRYVLDVEGGYSNDAGDPGGPTKYGINRYDAPYLRELGVPSIQSITPDQAREIYRAKYWNQGWAGLPAPSSLSNPRLAAVMFDTAVNPRQSVVKTVQRIFTNPNLNDDEKADEIIRARTQNYQGAKPQFVKGLTNRMAKLSAFVSSPSTYENSAFEDEEGEGLPNFTPSSVSRPKPRPAAQPSLGWRARTAADSRQIGYGSQNQGVDVRRVQAEIDRLRVAKKKKIAEINQRLVNAQNNHVIANVKSERRELSNIDSAIKTLLNKLSPPPSVPNGPPVYIKRLPKNVQGPLEVMKPYEYENTAGSLNFLHLNDISKIVKPASQPAKSQALDFTKFAQPPTPPRRQLTDYEKREKVRREFDNRKIKGYETATGPIQIVVKLPVSGTVVPATFKKAPTNGQMRDWIREHDRIASLQRGIAHPDVRDQFDKLNADAVEVANAIRYGSKSVKTKGGDGKVRLQWAAERVAKILGIRDVKKLMQRGTPEYKFFNHFVSQLGYTPDSDDVNFREAGIDAGTAGIIKRNPGLANENGAATYARSLATLMSPSELWSMGVGDPRTNEEISKSTVQLPFGLTMNEAFGRSAIDIGAMLAGTILTGGAAGVGRLGAAGLSRLGLRAGTQIAEKAMLQEAAKVTTSSLAKAFVKNGVKNAGLNALQMTPGILKNASDRSALTGEDFGTSLKASVEDAANGLANQYNPAFYLDPTARPEEKLGGILNMSMHGINAGKKIAAKGRQNLLESSTARKDWHSQIDEAVQNGVLSPHDAAAGKALWDNVALRWRKVTKGSISEFFDKNAPEIRWDKDAPHSALLQVEKLLSGEEHLPPGQGPKGLKDVAKRLDVFAKANPVFSRSLQGLPDEVIVNELIRHIRKEVLAWKKVSPDYQGFFTHDIEHVANPELRQFFKGHHGIDLSDADIKLFHLVSGLASAQRTPIYDSMVGFDVLERYKLHGDLSAHDVDKLFDHRTYNKIQKLIQQDGLENAMDWLSTNHSPEEISQKLGIPIESIRTTEYIDPTKGGLGLLAVAGPKMAPYILNRWQNRDLITKDMWFARTMARMTGQDLVMKSGKVRSAPWSTKGHNLRMRGLSDEAIAKVAADFGWDPIEVQEAMWDLEHVLYNMNDGGQKATFISGGVRKAIERRLGTADAGRDTDSPTNVLEQRYPDDQRSVQPTVGRSGSQGRQRGRRGVGEVSGRGSRPESGGQGQEEANRQGITFDQRQPGQVRKGAVSFTPGERPILYLFTGLSDVSTFLHESAHIFRRALPEQHLRSLHEVYGDITSVSGEEKFARGFERFLVSGKAPTRGLHIAFQVIRNRMLGVYGKIRGTEIESEVDPRIQKVFNQMLGQTSFSMPNLSLPSHVYVAPRSAEEELRRRRGTL